MENLKIVAGGEYAGAAGDHQAADRRIDQGGVDGVAHRIVHILRERVLIFWTPQFDDASGFFIRDDDVIGHADPWSRGHVAAPILHDPQGCPYGQPLVLSNDLGKPSAGQVKKMTGTPPNPPAPSRRPRSRLRPGRWIAPARRPAPRRSRRGIAP